MPADPSVVAENLSKRYREGVWGVVDVTFSVGKNETCAILGPNGAGKTTTVGILTTLLKPTGGRAYVGGFDVVREPQRVKEISALVPQDGRPDGYWTPREAVKWYLVIRGFSLSTAEREALYWLERLGIYSVRDVPALELSGGQKKRVLIAMALASNAEILFLDEPSAGLDIEGKHGLVAAVREASKDGRTVLFTTHDYREAETLADTIVIISRGKTVARGTLKSLLESLPYRCKIVAKGWKASLLVEKAQAKIALGDVTILYFEDCREAELYAREAELLHDKLDLEDAYLLYTSRG